MECTPCLDTLPFLDDVTQAVEYYGSLHKLTVLSLYHDEPLWIVEEPEQENVPIKAVQVELAPDQRWYTLSFIPSYYVIRNGQHITPDRIPPQHIQHVEISKAVLKEDIFKAIDEAFKRVSLVMEESPLQKPPHTAGGGAEA
jgi:hypothetical protein